MAGSRAASLVAASLFPNVPPSHSSGKLAAGGF